MESQPRDSSPMYPLVPSVLNSMVYLGCVDNAKAPQLASPNTTINSPNPPMYQQPLKKSKHQVLYDTPCPGMRIQINPLRQGIRKHLNSEHAGKYLFGYDPQTKTFIYHKRIGFSTPHSKLTRLSELLCDYAVHLLSVIEERRTIPLTCEVKNRDLNRWNSESKARLDQMAAEMRAGRDDPNKKVHLNDEQLAALAKDLKDCTCYDCGKKKYPEYFSGMQYENVVEMFHLLMDKDCEEEKKRWEIVVKAHIKDTSLLAIKEMISNTHFEEDWQERNNSKVAWMRLLSGQYRDLIVWHDGGKMVWIQGDDGEKIRAQSDLARERAEEEIENGKQPRPRQLDLISPAIIQEPVRSAYGKELLRQAKVAPKSVLKRARFADEEQENSHNTKRRKVQLANDNLERRAYFAKENQDEKFVFAMIKRGVTITFKHAEHKQQSPTKQQKPKSPEQNNKRKAGEEEVENYHVMVTRRKQRKVSPESI